MRKLILVPCLMAALSAAACTPTPRELAQIQAQEASEQEKLNTALAGLTPGKSVDCIDQFRSQQVSGYGPTILYKVSNGLIYRSETGGGCRNIGRDVLVTRTTTGRLCRGDIGQTYDPVARFPTGSCSFGDFTPYRKK